MTIGHYQYWLFPISEEDGRKLPNYVELIEFFAGIYADGAKVYWELPRETFYGAETETRSGHIIQRSFTRSRWQLDLFEKRRPRLTAYVDDFRTAGIALRAWLNGQSINNIFEDINEHLILLGGQKSSCTIYDPKDE